MRYSKPLIAASLAVLAATAFVATASALPPGEMLGAKAITIDGFKYGGNLPVGPDKNLDALKVLIKSADSMGQLRDNQYGGSLYLVLGDTTNAMRINAEGTWNGQKSHVVLDWDYRVPGMRLDVTSPDGKTRTIQVAAADKAWDEKTPGVFAAKASNSVPERLVIPYLMPSAVILAGRDAADKMKLGKDGARNTLTIPVPALGSGVNLVATLDADGHPIHTQIALGGKTYTGDFDEFLADRMDMAVNFSHHVVLKLDGKEIANLELNWHQANPYLIFPVPKEVASN